MNRRLFVACVAAPLLPDERITLAEFYRRHPNYDPDNDPNLPPWNPKEYGAVHRACREGADDFHKGFPYGNNPYDFKKEPYLWAGWMYGWITQGKT
jgi:hypothetical protein